MFIFRLYFPSKQMLPNVLIFSLCSWPFDDLSGCLFCPDYSLKRTGHMTECKRQGECIRAIDVTHSGSLLCFLWPQKEQFFLMFLELWMEQGTNVWKGKWKEQRQQMEKCISLSPVFQWKFTVIMKTLSLFIYKWQWISYSKITDST